MPFLILDPYLFIYPEEQLQPTKAAKFLRNLSDWADELRSYNFELGMSAGCLESLKHHQRSMLNSGFVEEIRETIASIFAQGDQVLIDFLNSLKSSLAFSEAMEAIKPEQLQFKITHAAVVPLEFTTRLPDYFQEPFTQMLAELTFARAQRFFPIAAFENVFFITDDSPKTDWLLEDCLLLVSVHVNYDLESLDDPHKLKNPLMDEFVIIQHPAALEQKLPKRRIRTLSEAFEAARSLCGNAVVISQELEKEIKKSDDTLPNAEQIYKIVCALGLIWLPEYRKQREQKRPHNEAVHSATAKFKQVISHEISGESLNVQQDPKLRNQRLVRYDGQELYTFLHVKSTPRIYFGVHKYGHKDIIVIGHIGHLETHRHNASKNA